MSHSFSIVHSKVKRGKSRIQTTQGGIRYGFLVNSAEAYADTLAKAYRLTNEYAMVPFMGIYRKLSKTSNYKVRASIYLVPDVSIPFLGVLLTRVISGDVYVRPTAIPASGVKTMALCKESASQRQ